MMRNISQNIQQHLKYNVSILFIRIVWISVVSKIFFGHEKIETCSQSFYFEINIIL